MDEEALYGREALSALELIKVSSIKRGNGSGYKLATICVINIKPNEEKR